MDLVPLGQGGVQDVGARGQVVTVDAGDARGLQLDDIDAKQRKRKG